MKRMLLLMTACMLLGAATVQAQDYGTGVVEVVPFVPQGAIVTDGVADEPIWDVAAMFDPLQYAAFYALVDEPDLTVDARALYTNDTLYIYMHSFDNALFIPDPGDAWQADQFLIGIDPVHEAGNTDTQIDEDYAGWPANAPDQGPYTIKVWPVAGSDGITLNWGFDGVDPVAEGWVRGTVFVDEENFEWGVEMAIFVPGLAPGSEIGFNVGGGQASQAAIDAGGEEGTYGYFSWQVTDPENPGTAGGDVMNSAASFATLTMQGQTDNEGYGTGVVVQVPRVDPGTITLDGSDDEAAWDMATVVDPLQYAAFYALVEEPDLAGEAKLLWSEGTLYVFVRMFDNAFFIPEAGDAWQADQILVGVDPVHEEGVTDTQIDPDYSGWVSNAPDQGPHTYKIWPVAGSDGITLNWGFDGVFPVDSMWVDGTVFLDENTLEWGVEMAITVPTAELGAEIGFNVGGAQASQAAIDAGGEEGTYGYFSWQVTDPENPGTAGGDVMNSAASFATLQLVEEVSEGVEEELLGGIPQGFVLDQNYPNPFNPATSIEYGLDRAGHVAIDVFNLLGQKVATLIDAAKPAGTYRVRWEAEDLPSGVYLYQLRVDGQVAQSRTMMLLK